MSLAVELCGLASRTRSSPPRAPSATASSTRGSSTSGLLGGLVSKGLYLEPRDGCPTPRIVETPSGLLNAIGLQGVGRARLRARRAAPPRPAATPPSSSTSAATPSRSTPRCRAILDGAPGVAGARDQHLLPQREEGRHGLRRRPADDPRGGGARCARPPALPVIPKLSPNVADIARLRPGCARRRGPTRSPASTPCSAWRSTWRRAGRGWPSAPAASRAPPSGRSPCAWPGRRRGRCGSR